MTAEFSKETFEERILESGHMTGTIGSDEWMNSLDGHALYFEKKARMIFAKRLNHHSEHIGSDSEARWKRIKQFMATLPK